MSALPTLMDAAQNAGQLWVILQSETGAALAAVRRLSHLSRRWGLSGPVAAALATLAFGDDTE